MFKTRLICSLMTIAVLMGEHQVLAENRALVVISELDHRGVKELAPLYRKIEDLAWKIPSESRLLQGIYSRMELITQGDATIEGTQIAILEILNDPTIEAVDVILGVHGRVNRIAFFDGSIAVQDWVSALKARGDFGGAMKVFNKLGWLYNLSCFGSSHIKSFLDLGFKTVIGSRKVNANAEFEYPLVLEAMALGQSVKMALKIPNSKVFLRMTDAPVRWLGKQQDNFLIEVDSYKDLGGLQDFRIR